MTATLTREDRLRDLHTAHHRPLIHFLVSLNRGDVGHVDDYAQEVWAKAWRHIDKLDDQRARQWLFAVARTVSIDANRARKSRPVTVAESARLGVELVAPDAYVVVSDRYDVTAALAGLSPIHRQALVHRFLLDQTDSEIAAELGIPVGTVKSRIHNGLRAAAMSIGGGGR